MADEIKIALLIDGENVSSKYVKTITDELTNYGVVTNKRIYGDFTKKGLDGWKSVLLDYSLTPIQQFSNTSGKNSADSALIIDAMDILYSGNVRGFCIVSSDSDFTRLISRLRESGMFVIAMGEEKTPKALRKASDKFISLDLIAEDKQEPALEEICGRQDKKAPAKPQPRTPSKRKIDFEIVQDIYKIIEECEEEWVNLGELGNRLSKLNPDFDHRNYGYDKFSKFVRDVPEIALNIREGKDNAKLIFVKHKTAAND